MAGNKLFKAYLNALLLQRGIRGYRGLAAELQACGFDFDWKECRFYCNSAGGRTDPPGRFCWTKAVMDHVLQLEEAAADDFVCLLALGRPAVSLSVE